MTEEIGLAERRGRVIVQDGQVGRAAGGDFAQGQAKLTAGNLAVVLQQQRRRFDEGHARVAVGQAVQQVGAAHLRQHVRVHPVGAEAHQHALLQHRQQRRDAHGVVHIRLGVVDDDRPGLGQDVHLGLIHVDAVDEDGLLAGHAQAVQAVHGRDPVPAQRILAVGGVLGNVDVAADAVFPGNAHAGLDGLVRNGERGVQAHHGGDLPVALTDLLDEALVFGNPAALDVAVGDLVTQRGAQTSFMLAGTDCRDRQTCKRKIPLPNQFPKLANRVCYRNYDKIHLKFVAQGLKIIM